VKPARSKATQAPRARPMPELELLADQIRRYAPHDGAFDLRLEGLHLTRRSGPYQGQVRDLQKPALCLVAQGAKTAMLGKEAYTYDPSRLVVFSVNLPLAFQLSRVSTAEPYLGLRLDLDPRRIADLVPKVFPHGLPKTPDNRSIMVGPAEPGIIQAAAELLALLARPEEAGLLAPLKVEEILIRLLSSPIGPRVAQMGFPKSGLPGVSKAVTWLCDHFDEPLKVESLAGLAAMSPSSFHQHFKRATAHSPLQYQKLLRLQEARRLMLSEMVDAGAAAQRVGYLSPSQFSREYGRLFGQPPTRDIERLREQVGGAAAG
jgi:AraC-like DNA-binding protein